jgi:hypothetical protein
MRPDAVLRLTPFVIALAAPVFAHDEPAKSAGETKQATVEATKPAGGKPGAEDVPLFDGKTLDGWKAAGFHKEGKLEVKDGCLRLSAGQPMSGLTLTDASKIPGDRWELEFEARKDDGRDFFVGLTFPLGKSHASLILGGWGGEVCGLSSIDGSDASENETNSHRPFEKGKWYKVKLRVDGAKVKAWVDGEELFDVDTEGRSVNIRIEVAQSRPLGLSTYRTAASYRKIVIRKLK